LFRIYSSCMGSGNIVPCHFFNKETKNILMAN
jgi:hypothetical protein